jgi:hypothetical protein
MSDLTPARRATDHQSKLVTALKANFFATVALIITLCGVVWAAEAIGANIVAWFVRNENTIPDIVRLKADVVDIDHRINKARAELLKIQNESERADLKLQAQFDTLAALAKMTADRSFQSPIPPAYQKAQPR